MSLLSFQMLVIYLFCFLWFINHYRLRFIRFTHFKESVWGSTFFCFSFSYFRRFRLLPPRLLPLLASLTSLFLVWFIRVRALLTDVRAPFFSSRHVSCCRFPCEQCFSGAPHLPGTLLSRSFGDTTALLRPLPRSCCPTMGQGPAWTVLLCIIFAWHFLCFVSRSTLLMRCCVSSALAALTLSRLYPDLTFSISAGSLISEQAVLLV